MIEAILALVVVAYALAAARLNRLSVGPALFFVVTGIVAAIGWTGSLPTVDAEVVLRLVELTLALILFTDASTIDLVGLRREADLAVRLLSVGLLLSIALGTLLAGFVFPELPIGVLLLVGAALAPTDAALGQPVVTNALVPVRIRRLLNAESGLNDGIATPFVLLGIAIIASEGGGPGDWLAEAVREALVGTLTGVALGVAGGLLLVRAERSGWASRSSRQLAVLALALAAYFTSIALGGNGFIAAFVGGLAFGAASRHAEEGAELFTEVAGSTLSIVVWIVAGSAFVSFLSDTTDSAATAVRDPQPDRGPDAARGDRPDRHPSAPRHGPLHGLVRPERAGLDRVRDPRPRGDARGRHGDRPRRRDACLDGPPVGGPPRPVGRTAGRPLRTAHRDRAGGDPGDGRGR